ncbi:MAG TPA: DUF6069 family protein [Propionibacteriaceae bacterium]|nr:DUF6069 family protein [Propionibacteriaceae bacterium]
MSTPITSPRRARALAVMAATLTALAVWLITDPLLGNDIYAPAAPGSEQLMPITAALVAITSLVAALAGWALLALLERFTARARTIWTVIALVFALLSLAGPMSALPSTSGADALALAFMHVAVTVVLIPFLASTSPRPATTSALERRELVNANAGGDEVRRGIVPTRWDGSGPGDHGRTDGFPLSCNQVE